MFKSLVIALSLALTLMSQPLLAEDAGEGPAGETATVNINKADAEALDAALVGIGRNKALAIVAHREKYGPFFAAEELSAVRGIGPSTVEKNRRRIEVD